MLSLIILDRTQHGRALAVFPLVTKDMSWGSTKEMIKRVLGHYLRELSDGAVVVKDEETWKSFQAANDGRIVRVTADFVPDLSSVFDQHNLILKFTGEIYDACCHFFPVNRCLLKSTTPKYVSNMRSNNIEGFMFSVLDWFMMSPYCNQYDLPEGALRVLRNADIFAPSDSPDLLKDVYLFDLSIQSRSHQAWVILRIDLCADTRISGSWTLCQTGLIQWQGNVLDEKVIQDRFFDLMLLRVCLPLLKWESHTSTWVSVGCLQLDLKKWTNKPFTPFTTLARSFTARTDISTPGDLIEIEEPTRPADQARILRDAETLIQSLQEEERNAPVSRRQELQDLMDFYRQVQRCPIFADCQPHDLRCREGVLQRWIAMYHYDQFKMMS